MSILNCLNYLIYTYTYNTYSRKSLTYRSGPANMKLKNSELASKIILGDVFS